MDGIPAGVERYPWERRKYPQEESGTRGKGGNTREKRAVPVGKKEIPVRRERYPWKWMEYPREESNTRGNGGNTRER